MKTTPKRSRFRTDTATPPPRTGNAGGTSAGAAAGANAGAAAGGDPSKFQAGEKLRQHCEGLARQFDPPGWSRRLRWLPAVMTGLGLVMFFAVPYLALDWIAFGPAMVVGAMAIWFGLGEGKSISNPVAQRSVTWFLNWPLWEYVWVAAAVIATTAALLAYGGWIAALMGLIAGAVLMLQVYLLVYVPLLEQRAGAVAGLETLVRDLRHRGVNPLLIEQRIARLLGADWARLYGQHFGYETYRGQVDMLRATVPKLYQSRPRCRDYFADLIRKASLERRGLFGLVFLARRQYFERRSMPPEAHGFSQPGFAEEQPGFAGEVEGPAVATESGGGQPLPESSVGQAESRDPAQLPKGVFPNPQSSSVEPDAVSGASPGRVSSSPLAAAGRDALQGVLVDDEDAFDGDPLPGTLAKRPGPQDRNSAGPEISLHKTDVHINVTHVTAANASVTAAGASVTAAGASVTAAGASVPNAGGGDVFADLQLPPTGMGTGAGGGTGTGAHRSGGQTAASGDAFAAMNFEDLVPSVNEAMAQPMPAASSTAASMPADLGGADLGGMAPASGSRASLNVPTHLDMALSEERVRQRGRERRAKSRRVERLMGDEARLTLGIVLLVGFFSWLYQSGLFASPHREQLLSQIQALSDGNPMQRLRDLGATLTGIPQALDPLMLSGWGLGLSALVLVIAGQSSKWEYSVFAFPAALLVLVSFTITFVFGLTAWVAAVGLGLAVGLLVLGCFWNPLSAYANSIRRVSHSDH
ncbi:MAG: hypothetical protein AAF958_02480 [Planctomycetota bacterium]